MESQHKGRPKTPGWQFVIAFSTAIILICVLAIGWFYSFQQEKLFAERQAFFTQVAAKTAENIDAAIDSYWRQNATCQEHLVLTTPADKEGLLENLAYCERAITANQAMVLAFTEEGSFCSSDGCTGRFAQEGSVSLSQDAPSRQTDIVNLPHVSNETTYFLLLEHLGRPFQVEDMGTVTHLALAIDVSSLQDLFATRSFGENCHTFFVSDRGLKLYQSSDSHAFIEGYNILTTLKGEAEVIGGGNMGDLLASFAAGDTTAFEIGYRGEDWFVSFQTVSAGGHHLIIFAPTDLIGNNAAELSQTSLLFLLFICLMLGLLFAVVVLWVRTMVLRLRDMNVLLEREAQAAEAANRAKGEFLSYMSHDIRTPINGIMGMTSIAMRSAEDHGKVMYCLGKIDEASGHLLSLVNDVLDLSRIEQGRTAIVSEPVSLPALLGECASIIEGQLSTRNLEFACDFEDLTHPYVMTDELHLRQILINILGNAVKFTPDGGKVTFSARQEDVAGGRIKVTLRVEDTGIGMEQEYLKHIWEPFSQSRQGHSATYEGTGLGMAITKRFVDMMGGTIGVESELGRGSAFTVTLVVDVAEGAGARKLEEGGAEGDLTGMRVLLVEDKELNLEIACEALLSAGASVDCAVNGREALDSFLHNPAGTYDAVLMDVMMPVMDGLAAARAIRASGRLDAESVPIIALTAHAFDEDVRKTAEAGMNFHLSKPIEERHLVRALASFRAQADPSESIKQKTPRGGSSPRPASAQPSLEGLRVLLAEDDDLNMEITRALLEERGARVTPAENGQLALQAFEDSPEGAFDVVLMDLRMPVMGGIEAVRRIRSLDRTDARAIPIFALTADYSLEDEKVMEESGVDSPLLKPLNMNLLVEAIFETYTRRSQKGSDPLCPSFAINGASR